MRAFISYSLNDSEQFVLTVLSSTLKDQGFIVSSSYDSFEKNIDDSNYTQLYKASLFIGLITITGNANNKVLKEWEKSNLQNIPSLLLIEQNTLINQMLLENENVVVFDRSFPESSVELIKNKIKKSNQSLQPRKDNTLAWVLGGIALLALIKLLSEEES